MLTKLQFFLQCDGKVQFVFCVGPCIVNYYNETKCVLLFLAVKSEPEALRVDRTDDAVKKKPILERTCKSIFCHGFRVTPLGGHVPT